MKTECPYLLEESGKKTCKQMIEHGLDEELDDFDITHYCRGNPNYCFYFRFFSGKEQVTEPQQESVSENPTVLASTIVLHEASKPNEFQESFSDESDKFSKLKRLLHNLV
jgi:hypothetical protein